jgi:hypothetical protein
MIGTDNRLSTLYLGFTISRHIGHEGFGTVNLMAKRQNEALFIELLFFKPLSEENHIPLLLQTLDACYRDCTRRIVYLLTLRNRLDYYKSVVKMEDGNMTDSDERARVKFAFWDEILASFRHPFRRPSGTPVSEAEAVRLRTQPLQVEGIKI